MEKLILESHRKERETMKIKELKDAEIERFCRFCQHSSELSDGDTMLCGKKGIVSADFICKKFVYDPLKREPKRLSKEVKLEFVDLGVTMDK